MAVPPPPKLIVASPKSDWHQLGTMPPWLIAAESDAPPSKAGAPLPAPMLAESILAPPTLETPTLLATPTLPFLRASLAAPTLHAPAPTLTTLMLS